MSLVSDQGDWVRLCGRAGLRDGQRAMLETLLSACDPDALLTRHVTGGRTAVIAVTRAHSVLESRGRAGRKSQQPNDWWAWNMAVVADQTLWDTSAYFQPGALDGAVSTFKAVVEAGKAGVRDAGDCRKQAELVAGRVAEVRAAVVDAFAKAWSGTVTPETGEHLALEMATLCVMEGRDHQSLAGDVRTALSRGPLESGRLLNVLLPAEREFRVAVVVEGSSGLESVAALMDPAAAPVLFGPGQPVTGRGPGTADLKALAALAEGATAVCDSWLQRPSRGGASGHVLLVFTVRARDAAGAALLGRRQASELLDQYVAGQRVAEIRLRPETLAYNPGSRRARRSVVPDLGSGPVRPLTTNWPPALRESLRTAHIAHVTEAPMTSAGLCWSALEALELKAGSAGKGRNVDALARALSLQATRQQMMDLHARMRIAVAAESVAARTAHREAQARADSLESVASQTAALADKAAAARAAVRDRYAVMERALEAEAHRATLDAWTGVGDDGLLRDPNRWLDVFAPPAGADPALRAAAGALDAITERLGGETANRLRCWRTLLADPGLLATWITKMAGRFEEHLDWLYAVRNTALHNGRFTSATDQLDAQAGRGLVDLTLEFLGNWYRHAAGAAPDRADWTAVEVIEDLAARQEHVVKELADGIRERWNMSRLTSPTSTGRDRT